MGSRVSKRLIASLALATLTRADYYIDDQNFTSLFYSQKSLQSGPVWTSFQTGTGQTLFFGLPNGTSLFVDPSHCYNYTYTYAPCSTVDDCKVHIPFDGSGITIYVLQAGPLGINATLAIDGGSPTYNVLPPPPAPNYYVPNVTLFSVQGMNTGSHTAIMTVLNWDNVNSNPVFDYVLINQTVVSSTTANTSSAVSSPATGITATTSIRVPTSTVTPTPSNSSKNVGPIVGGVVGGLAAFVALLLAFFYLRRRRQEGHREVAAGLDSEQRMDPFVFTEPPSRQTPEWNTGVTERSTSENLETSPASPRRQKIQQGVTDRETSQITGSSITSSIQAGSPGTSSLLEIPRHRIQQAHPALTNDQADLVTRLHENNVPAGAIARVIERMMAGERQSIMDEFGSLPPPSYRGIDE